MGIDFACRSVDLEQLVRCALGLTRAEHAILRHAVRRREFTVSALAREMGLDRTTVQKGLSKLSARGLVKRRQLNARNGGYSFHYEAKDGRGVKREVKSTIGRWFGKAILEADNWA